MDENGETPLHMAARNGKLDIVKVLCEKGEPRVNWQNRVSFCFGWELCYLARLIFLNVLYLLAYISTYFRMVSLLYTPLLKKDARTQ